MRYAFIKEHHNIFAISRMCQLLGVSTSGYYAWCQRPVSQRVRANNGLTAKIKTIFQASDGSYGSSRVYNELVEMGVSCSLNRVAGLMRRHGIAAKQPKKRPVVTTVRDPADPVAPNLLNRQFQALAPNRTWLADITYIPTAEGPLYLAAVLDLYSRKIVGWAMADHLKTESPLAALSMALQQRQPEPGLLHHSDRGSQYTSNLYQSVLDGYRCRVSMSRVANCLDNAPIESFFGTLKTERTDRRHYRTRIQAQADIFLYIEGFYNRRRRHSALGYLSPDQFEQSFYFSLN